MKYGFVSSAVKVGDTIRRQTGPWTPTVHSLLAYLQNHSFTKCPVVLGIDEKNREILKFIPGDAAVRPWPKAVLHGDGAAQAARLLREYHDIVEKFKPGSDVEWRTGKAELKPGQIIRHGDLGPWNTIWQKDNLVALIDWDFIQPGYRVEDLAQMAYYFVPLRGEEGWKVAGYETRPDFSKRLKTLVSSYGMYSAEEVVDALLILLESDRATVKKLGDESKEPWASFLKRGDIEESIKDTEWLIKNRNDILR